MNTTTDSQVGQELQNNESAAALAFSTMLSKGLMPQAPQEQPQAPDATQQPNPAPEPPTNQENGNDLKAEMQGLESRIMDEIGVLKSEIQKTAPKNSGNELENLKKEIEKIINE